jgi:hypothetical protein
VTSTAKIVTLLVASIAVIFIVLGGCMLLMQSAH